MRITGFALAVLLCNPDLVFATCATRNSDLQNTTHDATGADSQCLSEIKNQTTQCAKDPSVSADDMAPANDARAAGGANATFSASAQIFQMKAQKYTDRSKLCKEARDKVSDACK